MQQVLAGPGGDEVEDTAAVGAQGVGAGARAGLARLNEPGLGERPERRGVARVGGGDGLPAHLVGFQAGPRVAARGRRPARVGHKCLRLRLRQRHVQPRRRPGRNRGRVGEDPGGGWRCGRASRRASRAGVQIGGERGAGHAGPPPAGIAAAARRAARLQDAARNEAVGHRLRDTGRADHLADGRPALVVIVVTYGVAVVTLRRVA